MHACYAGMNRALGRCGTRLVLHEAEDGVDGGRVFVPVIDTERTDGGEGQPPRAAIARYCPFCGKQLRQERRNGGKEGNGDG